MIEQATIIVELYLCESDLAAADAIGLEHRPDEQISKIAGPEKRMRRTQEFAALDLELGEYIDLLCTVVFSTAYAWVTVSTFPDIPFSSFVVWFPLLFGVALFASQLIITMTSLGCCTWCVCALQRNFLTTVHVTWRAIVPGAKIAMVSQAASRGRK